MKRDNHNPNDPQDESNDTDEEISNNDSDAKKQKSKKNETSNSNAITYIQHFFKTTFTPSKEEYKNSDIYRDYCKSFGFNREQKKLYKNYADTLIKQLYELDKEKKKMQETLLDVEKYSEVIGNDIALNRRVYLQAEIARLQKDIKLMSSILILLKSVIKDDNIEGALEELISDDWKLQNNLARCEELQKSSSKKNAEYQDVVLKLQKQIKESSFDANLGENIKTILGYLEDDMEYIRSMEEILEILNTQLTEKEAKARKIKSTIKKTEC
ncbi:AAA family ATPase [Candidatus Bandiella euplotis]|uniref:Uncharacterized protein n=1 Tax=Candidatus Bandiella euplotis TaxID=1664265 RepID=A0ABZ0UJF8_9RICK|nr:hypothetical protein [Candidatus Bandiella woodruffii]WPX96234.1 hypothetical protein Bandiella_00343 [Candidatus Bandiella woodruffii]